ncbi:MAG: hypothetical protein AB8H03_13695 [Saprospiraceae bacterium]
MEKLIHGFILIFALTSLIGCHQSEHNTSPTEKPKNEVLILGTIHGGHLTDSIYNTAYLEKLIVEINPDYILAEIPPNLFDDALEGFKRDDTISEPRVMRFPEYVDVVFPLTKKMKFEIIPTAGWTRIMANERSQKLKAISENDSKKS